MSKRVLVCGDVDGDLEKLYADVTRQQTQHGKFDFLIATGKFLPSNKAQNAGLQAYVSKKKEVPIRTYFIDSESGIFMKTAPDGRKLGETQIEFLGSFGVKEVDGLRIGYLSGTMNKDKFHEEASLADGRPAHVEGGHYTRAMIDSFKELASDGPLDLLITSEWPEGLENSIGEAQIGAEHCSSAITELCVAFEPRFHIFGMSGQFHRCQPYLPVSKNHVCRPIGLGKVNGPKGKDKKCLHALILVPKGECSATSLMRGSDEASPCPYSSRVAVEAPGKRRQPGTPAAAGAPAAKLARTVPTPPGFNIRKDGAVTVLDLHLGKGRRFSIETGKVFKQAGGAVVIRDGKTQVWGTTCASKVPSDKDFLPLSVEYKERTSGAGKTPGGFIKRDKPMCEDHEILVCRFTDRPLRPLFPDTWNAETQILLFTMGFDGVHPPEPLAICAASASVLISDIPIKRPIAGVMVAMLQNDEYVVNPTVEERTGAKMCVMVAGTTEAVSMIEMTGDFVTEDQFLDGVMVGHEAIKVICNGLIAFDKECGKPKRSTDAAMIPPQLAPIMERKYGGKIDLALRSLRDVSATEHEEACSKIEKEAIEELVAKEGVEKPFAFAKKDVVKCFKKMCSLKLMHLIKSTGFRPDGRRADEVRDIAVEQRVIDNCHGTSLFTRGDTQTIATCTLGDSASQQKCESIVDPHKKRFYLQYFFPPSCVGDVKRMTKGRREVGHGNLAERAVQPSIPSHDEFPYTIRTESFITESCGSSSMASVCGASLAMHDAGVPVKCLVSGVAMGMVDVGSGVASDEAIILSDIAELEDFIGKMDFKVAGNETGISAVQLDVKNEGLTRPLFARALEQARGSRLHILDEMKKHVNLDEPVTLPPNVPRILKIEIPADAKGKIIGPGGSNIRKLISEFDLANICVDDANFCEISGTDETVLNTVKMIIEDICQSGGPGGRGSIAPNTPKLNMNLPAGGKGKLIGRQGSTIKGLIEEFGLADIKICDDTNTVDLYGADEEKREACKAKILELYEGFTPVKGKGKGKGGASPQQSAAVADSSLTIPKTRLGRVIGRAGATIKALIEEFGLEDVKARDNNQGEGVIELFGGSPDQRECCMEKIKSMIYEDGAAAPLAAPKMSTLMGKAGGMRPVMGMRAMVPQQRVPQNTMSSVRPPNKFPGQLPPGGAPQGQVRAPLRQVTPKSASVPIVPKNPAAGTGPAPKVSEDLKMKLQMEFAAMCPGDVKSYRLLPHEAKLAKDLAAAFEMPITQKGNEFVVTRPMDEGY